jgi:hypothetical protein
MNFNPRARSQFYMTKGRLGTCLFSRINRMNDKSKALISVVAKQNVLRLLSIIDFQPMHIFFVKS